MAKRILGFNENDHRRVSRVVKRVEAMRDTRARRQRRFATPNDNMPFYNSTNSVAPLGAVMKVVGTVTISGKKYLETTQPDGRDLHDCVINLSADVGYQQTGYCTYGPAKVFCDEADDLEIGDGLGTYANYWSIEKGTGDENGHGFRYIGGQDKVAQTAWAVRDGQPGCYAHFEGGTPLTLTSTTSYLPHNIANVLSFGEIFDYDDDQLITLKHRGLYEAEICGSYAIDSGETLASPPGMIGHMRITIEQNGTNSQIEDFGVTNDTYDYVNKAFAMKRIFSCDIGDTLQFKASAGSPDVALKRYGITVQRVALR